MAGMDYMRQALSLARLALGQASPNPAVGAVIVKDGQVVGQGYTQPPGLAHAEVVALRQAGDAAREGTLYVTLEPCCHQGRTPPCTEAIINAGIHEVHMALLDPNPLVAGQGKEELERAGIKTRLGRREDAARALNEAYIKYITTGMPFVTAKFAVSLDGKIATRTGDSKWISGDESRKYTHYLRYANDAIMAGVNTVLVDNPRLTTRCGGGRGGTVRSQPLRVIVDSQGRVLLTAQIFSEPGETLVALGRDAKKEEREAFNQAGAELLEIASSEGMVDVKRLLVALAQRGIISVLVEGGGTLFGYLFDHKLVDKVVAFVAPIIIGGSEAKTAVAGLGADTMAGAIRLKNVRVERLGEDVVIIGYVD